MPTPDFLSFARTWRGVADHLDDAGVPFSHPLRAVWRELAWCQLLQDRGLDPLVELRKVVARLTGEPPPDSTDAVTLLAALRPLAIPHLSRLPDPLRRCPAVCTAVALPVSELPELVVWSLAERVHDRGGEREVRFDWRCRPALLPVWWEGRLQVLRWGNRDRSDRKLSPTGWTWQESVEAGKWAGGVNAGEWAGGAPAPGRRTFDPGEKADDAYTGTLYAAMVKQFRVGVTHLNDQGHTPTVRGFVWMQGEADAKQKESATTYAASLSRLRKRLAEDLKCEADLPLVFGQVLPHEPPAARFTHRKEVREQMAACDSASKKPEAMKNATMVSTDGFSLLPDTVHSDAAGQLKLGKAFAAAMKKLQPATPRK